MAQGHPTAAAMASYTRSRLPFARPQTLQNPPNPQKSGQLRREQVPQQAQHAPLSHAKATTRPQQWLKSTPRPQQWLLLYAFKAAVCQAANPPKPSKPSKSPASSAGKRYPNKPNTRHSRMQKPPQGHSNGSRAPHGRSNGFLYAFKAAVCQASNAPKPSKPSKSPASSAGTPTSPTRATLARKSHQGHSNGSRAPHGRSNGFFYTRSRLPFARPQTLQNPPNPPKVRPAPQGKGTPTSPTRATPARKSHHKATAMAQGHPTAAAMASYTRSRLPFARPQTLQNPPNPPKVRPAPQGTGTPTSPTRATLACKSHHKATAMAQEHPTAAAMASFIRVQGCRLPGLKPSKPSKSPASSAGKRYPNKPNTRHSRTQKPPQGHSNGSRAPHGRSNGFFYTRSRLPFARPQTLQNPPNPPKVRPAPQGTGTPTSPTRATLACKSHHKATAMAQEHPTAAAMASFTCIHLSVLRYYKKNWGFGDIFSFWFFKIKLFSELVALYFQTLLQKPS